MRVQFTNPRVAKEFEAAEGFADRIVHLPKLYAGKLSNISFAGALKMVEGKSNLISRKKNQEEEAPPAPAAEQTPAEE